jgi:V8-like Glu-specific endopeptidase
MNSRDPTGVTDEEAVIMSNPEDASRADEVVTGVAAAAAEEAPHGSGELAETTSSPARLSNGERVESAESAQLGADYWTPERMSRAIPITGPGGGPAAEAATTTLTPTTGLSGSTPPAAAIASAANALADEGLQLTAAITESAVVGKVFFHNPSDGLDYTASAGALNSPSKQLVITAGHCVHGGSGGTWMTNWVFVPRYRSGARPFGTFSAKQFRTFDAWINNSDLGRDVAMVTTFPLNGNKLVDVIGGNGLNWNWPRNVDITTLAYPSNFNSGEIQQWCQGATSDGGGYTIKIRCNFGGGASGGPWLMSFDNATGRGQVDGVMSTVDSAGFNRSSYFDDAVKAMFDAQGSVT